MSLPKTFRQLEYIQTTGTQYIDPNLTQGDIGRIHTVVTPTNPNGSWQALIFSERSTSPYNGTGIRINQSNEWQMTYGSNNTRLVAGNAVSGTQYEIDMNGVDNNVTVNGTSYSPSFDKSIDSSLKVDILTSGTGTGMVIYAKLSYIKVYDTSLSLIRDLIAVQRKSDSEVGLYDLANDVFYTNDGTGTFVAGPVVDENTNISKVVYGSDTLIDLTLDTVTALSLESGITAHSADGSMITGTLIKAVPIDIDNDTDMAAVLVASNVGKCYRFTGTTGTYTNGDLYIVEESV